MRSHRLAPAVGPLLVVLDNLNIHLAFPGRKVGDFAAPAGREARRRKVIGRTKTEMKAKFRDLRRDLDSGACPA